MLKREIGENYQNCWEYWKCRKELQKQCPVYKDKAGKNCWMYTDNLKVFDWVAKERGFKSCRECPWYQHMHK